jgi:hypothetical protein
MSVKLPQQLSRDALLAIVAGVQERMYLDLDDEGCEYWNPDKEWSGADICMEIQDLLHQHGLVPGDEEEYVPPPADDASEQLIICLDGGFVQDVYSSLPDMRVVVVDWDVADALPDDPKVLTAETPHGEVHAAVREADVIPIGEAVGTDLEAVIVAAREQDFLSADVPLRVPPTADLPENALAVLVTEATTQGVSSEDLDEAVHDAVSGLATKLNNDGLEAQIEFLMQRLGADETRRLLGACLVDKP